MSGKLGTTAFAAVALLGVGGAMGGWAVVTVENPPASLEAGGNYQVEFAVRQHGANLLTDLSPKVRVLDAARGNTLAEFPAHASSHEGRYASSLTIPRADSVRLVVVSGFGRGRHAELTLMPVPVAARGARLATMAPADWGHRLFVAKGCGTCHINGDVPEWAQFNEGMQVGPELTGRRLDPKYVRQRLTDPASLPPIGSTGTRMPNLGLSPTEVDALVAFLTGPKVSATD